MRTLGLIGGMSWESTVTYYRLINEGIKARLGGYHSAKVILNSVDFAEIEELQRAGAWGQAGEHLAATARSLERAGAEFLVLCTNTMHNVAPAIDRAVALPFLHIVDPTAAAIRAAGLKTIGLLGTRFTMEQDFYRGRLYHRHGIEALVPEAADRGTVHRVIYVELVQGNVRSESRAHYLAIIDRLKARGAEGIILGCTEISMLISTASLDLPCFDTTELHAEAAVEMALA
jgi:aspartate racemase